MNWAQALPTPVPTPGPSGGAGGGGGGVPGIDIGALASAMGQAFQTVLTSWATTIPAMILDGLRGGLTALWNGLWGSGANMLATPFALTIDFPPARVLGHELTFSIYGVTVLAIALLALRAMFRTMTGQGGALTDTVDGILIGSLLAGTSTLILGQAFLLVGLASDAIGKINYSPAFDPQTLLTVGPNLFLGVLTLIVMLVYGWKLMLRAAYRIVLLMFLTPIAPIASILWAIPQVRWVAVLYWVMMGGWLAGGVLAVAAVSLGVQLVTIGNTNNVLALIFGVALVQLAHDLMALLPKGALGGIAVGSPFRLFAGVGLGGAAVTAAAVAGAAVGAAAAGGGGAAGALPSGGDRPGFGYE